MKKKINKGLVALIAVLVCAASGCSKKEPESVVTEYTLTNSSIRCSVVSVGTVEPQNRLELTPPVNGRIDQILVDEGEKVKKGQIVAWISSTDRAAVLDAASAVSKEEQIYWQTVYKPTPIIASIDGEVIVRSLEPGQAVTLSTPVIVISDRLIVEVRVDETDIGKINVGMRANIKMDAYPDVEVSGKVDRISYESKINNNVVVYEVEVLTDSTPDVFRSGMSVEVSIYYKDIKDIIAVPFDSVIFEGGGAFVRLKSADGKEPVRRDIKIGVTDNRLYEVKEGLSIGDVIVVNNKNGSYSTEGDASNNPFMPKWRKKR